MSAEAASTAGIDPMNEMGIRDWAIAAAYQASTGTKYRIRYERR